MKIHVLKLKLRKLHKYLGFAFSIFILHLTVTGILLTYPETFKVEEKMINKHRYDAIQTFKRCKKSERLIKVTSRNPLILSSVNRGSRALVLL